MLMEKINAISLKKLNNAEYAYFAQQVSNLIHEGTAEKLHVSAATLTAFDANLKLLTDIVAQSRISDETADIVAVDKEADDLITYILSAIRSAKQPNSRRLSRSSINSSTTPTPPTIRVGRR